MNVAYLDPTCSRHFHEHTACIAACSGGNSLALLSPPADLQCTMDDKSFILKPGDQHAVGEGAIGCPSSQKLRFEAGALKTPPRGLPPEIKHAEWASTRAAGAAAVFSQAVEWFIAHFVSRNLLARAMNDGRDRVAARAGGAQVLFGGPVNPAIIHSPR